MPARSPWRARQRWHQPRYRRTVIRRDVRRGFLHHLIQSSIKQTDETPDIFDQALLYHAIRYTIYARYRALRRKQIFHYKSNYWDNTFSASDPGSSLQATEAIKTTWPALVERPRVRSFLDIPCGYLRWMQHVPPRIGRYIGMTAASQ